MILTLSSSIFGTATAWRRRWYARHPLRRSRLSCPVISVGNLRAGGSGKTPVVESLARLLAAEGERPAVLSRGYARLKAADGVTVVSDGAHVISDLDHAGDEPLMLARSLPGVSVLVGPDRYLSGRFAERRLGATVHLLDDGFQHLSLARDIDLLLLDEGDLADRVLPRGRLREPLAAAACADAVLTPSSSDPVLERFRSVVSSRTVFQVHRTLERPHWLSSREPAVLDRTQRFCAVAGIARPERFFEDLRTAGWAIAETVTFRDHHRYTADDIHRIERAARAAGAAGVVTTEKDAVRLENLVQPDLQVAVFPLTARIEPAEFVDWLRGRLQAARLRPTDAGVPLPSTAHEPWSARSEVRGSER